MDAREKQEYDALVKMTETDGWLVLVRNTKERIEAFQSGCPFNIKDEGDLMFHRGVIATLLDLIALPDKLEALREEVQGEE